MVDVNGPFYRGVNVTHALGVGRRGLTTKRHNIARMDSGSGHLCARLQNQAKGKVSKPDAKQIWEKLNQRCLQHTKHVYVICVRGIVQDEMHVLLECTELACVRNNSPELLNCCEVNSLNLHMHTEKSDDLA